MYSNSLQKKQKSKNHLDTFLDFLVNLIHKIFDQWVGARGPGKPPCWRTRNEFCMELGSVTLKRIGFFCFPIEHSTHTQLFWVVVDFKFFM